MVCHPARIAPVEHRLQPTSPSAAYGADSQPERPADDWSPDLGEGGDEESDDCDDFDVWPPDDLDLELDDEPEPEPGDFWLPDDDEDV